MNLFEIRRTDDGAWDFIGVIMAETLDAATEEYERRLEELGATPYGRNRLPPNYNTVMWYMPDDMPPGVGYQKEHEDRIVPMLKDSQFIFKTDCE